MEAGVDMDTGKGIFLIGIAAIALALGTAGCKSYAKENELLTVVNAELQSECERLRAENAAMKTQMAAQKKRRQREAHKEAAKASATEEKSRASDTNKDLDELLSIE